MPPAAQDQSTEQTQVRQVAGSEDAALRLGASADVVPQLNLADPAPSEEEGAQGAPPQTMGSAPAGLNPEEELDEAQPPFEATCPTCEKPLAVYTPDPSVPPEAHNAYKRETGFCVVCGRRWTKDELEQAGSIQGQATGDAAAASAQSGAQEQAPKADGPDGTSKDKDKDKDKSKSTRAST